MGKLVASGIIAVAAAALAGCAQARSEAGPMTSRSYPVGQFDSIEVAGPYEVTVATGQAPSVRATGNQDMIERLVVEVEDGALKIHPRKSKGFGMMWSNHGNVKIAVTAPGLTAADIAGSGGIAIDRISGPAFDGTVAGSGDLKVAQLDVQRLKMSIGGSGEIEAAGRAKTASYEIGGSGDIRAAGLSAEHASVSIAGSGSVAGHATGTAKVDIAGSGDVKMTGGARCEVSKMGSGDVDCS